ncbi:MAG: DUF642 domain-containing protein [Verrucomicrobiales bacterium]|nr:DUF642 domain-containing protein [Verrucomicrobiales bacterium]
MKRNHLVVRLLAAVGFSIAAPSLWAASFVRNPSFESNYNDTFPHYGAIDEWSGGSGVNEAGGPFHNNGTPIPDALRIGFSQGSTLLTQEISGLTPNQQYWIQFQYDTRKCCGGTIDIVVKWNDTELAKFPNVKPADGGAPYQFANVPFIPDSDAGTVTFQTVASGDATALFDGVTIVQRDAGQVAVANPSFEGSGVIVGDGIFLDQGIAGWTATGTYGVNTAGSGTIADNGAVPDQDNVAFLQGNSSLSQTLRNIKIGTPVKVTFAYNAKSGEAPHLQLKNGDSVVFEADVTAVGGNNAYKTQAVTFNAADTLVPITFVQTKDGQTLLLDDVKVEAETGVEFAPIAFDPTGVEMAPSQKVTVKVNLDPAAVKTKDIIIKLRSPNPNVVQLLGADADGVVTLNFPKNGADSATFEIEALARGVVRIEIPETSGLKLGDDVSVNVVSSFVRNSSFESNPAPSGIGAGRITSWEGGTGLNKSAGPFHDNGEIPDRDQVAVLQGNTLLSQPIAGLAPGKNYWLQFRYNARNCCGGTIDLSVKFDGKELTKVTGITPVGDQNPYSFQNLSFTPSASNGLLEFVTTAQGDATVLLDAVSIVQRDAEDVVIQNSSFEATGNPVGVGYVQPRKIAGWDITGGYGVNITGLGPFTDNGDGPDQDRVLFLQGNDSLSQFITGLSANDSYTLIYSVNARNCCGAGLTQYSVSFADVPLIENEEVQPVGAGIPYVAKYIVFTPGTTEGELRFNTAPEGDHTLLLDNIRIVKGSVAAPIFLSVTFEGGNLRISWPVDATDFKLESTTGLPGGWTADNSAISVEDNQNVVRVPLAGATRFYRLRK